MRRVRVDEQGRILDANTGEVIGKKGNTGRIILKDGTVKPSTNGNYERALANGGMVLPPPVEAETKEAKVLVSNEPTEADRKLMELAGVSPKVCTKSQEPIPLTKYEVGPETEFQIDFCLGFKNDRPQVYASDAYLQDTNNSLQLERHWARFRMWTYSEELNWQGRCLEYKAQTGGFTTNRFMLNELKIRHLLKSWSLEEINPKFKLLHVNGYLSDESYNALKCLYPSIVNHIIDEMNRVLEYNG